eukprot:12929693-Prorocentrum_lima.AAC.1
MNAQRGQRTGDRRRLGRRRLGHLKNRCPNDNRKRNAVEALLACVVQCGRPALTQALWQRALRLAEL